MPSVRMYMHLCAFSLHVHAFVCPQFECTCICVPSVRMCMHLCALSSNVHAFVCLQFACACNCVPSVRTCHGFLKESKSAFLQAITTRNT